MRRLSNRSGSPAVMIVLAFGAGCGALGDPFNSGSGGTTAVTGTGGAAAGTGGSAETGGSAPGTGGLASTGGVQGVGSGGAAGMIASGGRAGTGGNLGTGGAAGAAGGSSGATSDACARWKADRADLSEGTWTGSLTSCDPGDLTGAGRANALRQVNLYRFLAGLPAVTEDATKTMNAQACALLEHANKMLSHEPPQTWTCYMSAGATAAGQSNIATTAGVRAVGLYMNDHGNETTIGHRRWILSNSLGPVGLGSTSGYSCLMTIGGSGKAGKAYAAWPPPGDVPLGAITIEGSVDAVGWSIQSDTINLASAQVTVTDGTASLPVTVMQLPANYGSKYAISFVPMGWKSAAGHAYTVTVTGTATPISYTVNVVGC